MKETLTDKEFWFLRRIFGGGHYNDAHVISSLSLSMMHDQWFYDTEYYISELAKEKILSLSPDGYSFKITDLGVDLLEATMRKEEEWKKPGVIRVATFTKDQLVIPANSAFTAQRVLRGIFSEATQSLDILDPYIDAELFDRIDDAAISADIRILTKSSSSTSYFMAFKQKYRKIELGISRENVLHDRFIIINRATGYHVGHSLKDLGKKDTQISKIHDIKAQLLLFEQRWKAATLVT